MKLACSLLIAAAWLAPAARLAHADSPPGRIRLCTDIHFKKCSNKLSAGTDVYIHVEFPSPVLQVYRNALGADNVRSTGQYVLGIAKNIDDENPIVMSAGQVMISRFDKQKSLDLTLQASAATIEKIAAGGADVAKAVPFNSITTMGNGGTSMLWSQQAMKFADGTSTWEMFLIAVPMNGDDGEPKLIAQTRFSYAIDKASRRKLGAGSLEAAKYEQVADNGIKTGVHKANVGKLVFGPRKMLVDFDDPSALVRSTRLRGGLYARVYMKASAKNILAEQGLGQGVGEGDTWLQLTITVDGKHRVIDDHLRGEEATRFTSFSVTLVPGSDAHADDNPKITRKFIYLMSTLGKGKHQVAFEYKLKNIGGDDIVFATGELQVEIATRDRDAVARKWGNKLPGRGLLDSEKGLEKQLRKLWPKIKVYRAPYAWDVYTGGAVVYRTTSILAAYKNDEGGCTIDMSLIRQDRSGRGFGKAYLPGKVPPQTQDSDLPCQNMTAR